MGCSSFSGVASFDRASHASQVTDDDAFDVFNDAILRGGLLPFAGRHEVEAKGRKKLPSRKYTLGGIDT